MSLKTAKWVARICIGLSIAMIISAYLALLTSGENSLGLAEPNYYWENAYAYIAPLTITVYLTLAGLILSRNPFHIIGWLFLLISFFLSTQLVGLSLSQLRAINETVPVRVIEVLAGDIWIPSFIIPLTIVLQFFPNGRLPSRRWWPVTILSILGMTVLYLGYILHPWPWPENGITKCCNPLAVPWGKGFFGALETLSGLFLLAGFVGSLAAVVSRYRRSKGIERAQMKWLVYVAGLFLGIFILAGATNQMETDYFGVFFLSTPVIMAITIGVAILRYRLFDIDLIIRRTLQYALLTGTLGMFYYGGIILFQILIGGLTSEQNSPISIVLVTLGLAALFNPLRTRIQDFIDRRFYRSKYDSEKALANFSAAARDEVDLEILSARLMTVVGESMQPAKVQLFLKSRENGR